MTDNFNLIMFLPSLIIFKLILISLDLYEINLNKSELIEVFVILLSSKICVCYLSLKLIRVLLDDEPNASRGMRVPEN